MFISARFHVSICIGVTWKAVGESITRAWPGAEAVEGLAVLAAVAAREGADVGRPVADGATSRTRYCGWSHATPCAELAEELRRPRVVGPESCTFSNAAPAPMTWAT